MIWPSRRHGRCGRRRHGPSVDVDDGDRAGRHGRCGRSETPLAPGSPIVVAHVAVAMVDAVDRRRHMTPAVGAVRSLGCRHGRCGRSETPQDSEARPLMALNRRVAMVDAVDRRRHALPTRSETPRPHQHGLQHPHLRRHGRCGRSETPVDTSIGQGNGRQSRKVVLPPPRWKALCRSPRIRHRTGRLPAAPAPER